MLSNEEYVDLGGLNCPNCGRTDSVITNGSLEISNGVPYQECICDKCGASWTDIYGLVEYDNLKLKDEVNPNVQ